MAMTGPSQVPVMAISGRVGTRTGWGAEADPSLG